METVLIAGGSGLIGNELTHFLTNAGYSVKILTRKPTDKKANLFQWNVAKNYIDPEALTDVTAIINLAGSPIIGSRWTVSEKIKLRNSRILTSRFLVNQIIKTENNVKTFIQASAMGYFGDSGDKTLKDDSPAGKDFMATLCSDWEKEVGVLPKTIETSILRIGLYLSKAGGVYHTIAKLAKYYLASSFGSGKQYINYTHKHEFNHWVLELLNQNIPAGTYNAVGRHPLTMNEFVRAIAKNENRRVVLPNVPSFVLRLALGEAADALLNSYRITSPKLAELNLYHYNSAEEALNDL